MCSVCAEWSQDDSLPPWAGVSDRTHLMQGKDAGMRALPILPVAKGGRARVVKLPNTVALPYTLTQRFVAQAGRGTRPALPYFERERWSALHAVDILPAGNSRRAKSTKQAERDKADTKQACFASFSGCA